MSSRSAHASCGWLVALALAFVLLGALVVPSVREVVFGQACEAKYPHVNGRTVCADKPVINKKGYASLRGNIEEYIELKKQEKEVTHVSVYFRDLNIGPVFGVHELDSFAPASLLKVPLAILYLSKEEESPGFLTRQPKLRYTLPGEAYLKDKNRAFSSLNLSQAFPPPDEIKPGEPYGVEDLLFRLLAYSDNRANDLLTEHALAVFGEDEFVEIFRELGMLESDSIGDEVITVRSYSSMFRLLYNVSFLNPELSEKMLSWLSQSSFTEGLVAGVPAGVRVAHKFGERELEGTSVQQLHDCGVVYYPDNPYLLCVMTKGKDVHTLAGVIADISRFVYEEVDSRRL